MRNKYFTRKTFIKINYHNYCNRRTPVITLNIIGKT